MKTNGKEHPNLKIFRDRLKEAVVNTGFSPYTLAKNMGVDKQAISKILLYGRDPQLSTVINIAKYMNISLDWLLGIESSGKLIQPQSTSENICIDSLNFDGAIVKLHHQDIELLKDIAEVLNKRRTRLMTRLITAVREVKSPVKNESALKTTKLEDAKKDELLSDDDADDHIYDDLFDDVFVEDEDINGEDLDAYDFDEDDD